MADSVDVTIKDNPDEHRYEAVIDGEVAGFAQYRLRGNVIDVHHTVVEDAYEGKGVGSRLAKGVLEDVRARGLEVIASCPFIKGYIEKHDAYQDLLAS